MKNRFKTVSRLLFAGAALVMAVVMSAASPSTTDVANSRAAQAKARRLVETAGPIMSSNVLLGMTMYQRALELAPGDTIVKMAVNNATIALNPDSAPVFHDQLRLLAASKDAPMAYYYTLTQVAPVLSHDSDSLLFYDVDVQAYKRFPTQELFIDKLLGAGVAYLYDKKYATRDGVITDTLVLNPTHIVFGNNILAWADTIEQRNGYSNIVDRARAAIYQMLDRRDDLKRLAATLESRDSTDVATLDLLTTIAFATGDSLTMNKLGIRRFDIEPDPDHVFSMYDALTDGAMLNAFADRVIKKSYDSDLDPQLRIALLKALTDAIYSNSADTVAPADRKLLGSVRDALREIAAEDPNDEEGYFRGLFLSKNTDWLDKYGYSLWVDAVNALPDSSAVQMASVMVFLPVMTQNSEFENALVRLQHKYAVARPDLELAAKLALAQYYFNTEAYRKALDILQPVTLATLDEEKRLRDQYTAAHPDFDDADQEEENSEMKRWIFIQTMISECQMKLDRIDDALATLNQIIAIDPENAEALNNLAYYMCINGRDLTIALSLVERALAINPENLNAIDTRAWIRYKKGDIEGAMKDMENFFAQLNIPLQSLLDTESDKTAYDIVAANANLEAVGPIVGHLLAILAKSESATEAQVERIAEAVRAIDPLNEDLLEYLNSKATDIQK